MNLKKGFRFALTDFRNLAHTAFLPMRKVILAFLLLTAILTTPLFFEVGKSMTHFKSDLEKITEAAPDFEIKNDQLTSPDNKGGIFLSDSLILTVDPEDKRSAESIFHDANTNNFAIGFQKDNLILALPTHPSISSFFEENNFTLTYKSLGLNGFSKDTLKKVLTQKIPFGTYLLLFLGMFLPIMFSYLVDLLMIAIAIHLYSRLLRLPMTFKSAFSLGTFGSTWSVIFLTVASFFHLYANDLVLMMFVTLLITTYTLRYVKRNGSPKKKPKN